MFTTITGAEIQIVFKIFSMFFGHFCFGHLCFAMVYAKTIIHLSVVNNC